MIHFKKFTGGIFETHSYLLEGPQGNILIDAAEGADAFFAEEKIDLLLLTHGHFDHIVDVAPIQRRHQCPVGIHPESAPMLMESNYFQKFGFALNIEPVIPDLLLQEAPSREFCGLLFTILLVPGHCPGSLCFYNSENGLLFGGDVLFREGIGRSDLPGGNHKELLTEIATQLLHLPENTRVLPGHGPETTIGHERIFNPFLAP